MYLYYNGIISADLMYVQSELTQVEHTLPIRLISSTSSTSNVELVSPQEPSLRLGSSTGTGHKDAQLQVSGDGSGRLG